MAFSNRSFDYSSKHLIPYVVMDDLPTEKTDGAVGALCIDKESGPVADIIDIVRRIHYGHAGTVKTNLRKLYILTNLTPPTVRIRKG